MLQCTLKEKIPIFLVNTLLLHITLLALTDLLMDGQRNKLILVGLGNLPGSSRSTLVGLDNLTRFLQLIAHSVNLFPTPLTKKVLVFYSYVGTHKSLRIFK